jgi:hypothetical protein
MRVCESTLITFRTKSNTSCLVISAVFAGAARPEPPCGGLPPSSCHRPRSKLSPFSPRGTRSKSGFLPSDLSVVSPRESSFGPKIGPTTRKKANSNLTDFSQYFYRAQRYAAQGITRVTVVKCSEIKTTPEWRVLPVRPHRGTRQRRDRLIFVKAGDP